MAGAYPDVPSHRIAYDRDGSTVTHIEEIAGTTIKQLSSAEKVTLNDESSDSLKLAEGATGGTTYRAFVIIFPELRDIAGWAVQWTGEGFVNNIQTSPDTTNGIDGTWTVQTGNISQASFSRPGLRDDINAVNWTGVKAVKIYGQCAHSESVNTNLHSFHLYGTPASGQAPDRLRIWDPTTNNEVGGAFFDWGDTPRNAVTSKTFRIYNPSSQTAQGVAITVEALSDATPTLSNEFTFSVDGGSFQASPATVGDIGPASASPVIEVKRTVASNAELGVWFPRFVVSASSYA